MHITSFGREKICDSVDTVSKVSLITSVWSYFNFHVLGRIILSRMYVFVVKMFELLYALYKLMCVMFQIDNK